MNKKIVIVGLIVVILVIVAFNVLWLSGTYTSESGFYEIEFKPFGQCRWLQSGMFFEGTYENNYDGTYSLFIEGSGTYSNTEFTAEKDNGDLIVNGGIVFGERFTK